MVMDYGAISEGIVSGLATHHLAKLTSQDKTEIHTQSLIDLCETLRDLHTFLSSHIKSEEFEDLYEIVTLYKTGSGSSWIPNTRNRTYIRLLIPSPTNILVSSALASPFVLSFTSLTNNLWTVWDWPDRTSFVLDATSPTSQVSVYARYTNVPPS